MRRLILACTLLLPLGGCGADGAPVAPGDGTGVTVTGEGRFGVSGEL